MPFVLVDSEDKCTLLYSVILILIFFFYIMPKLEACYVEEKAETTMIKEAMDDLKDFKLVDKTFSRKCCHPSQYPSSINVVDRRVDLKKVHPNNYTGRGGCLCMPKKTWNYLANRGNNA